MDNPSIGIGAPEAIARAPPPSGRPAFGQIGAVSKCGLWRQGGHVAASSACDPAECSRALSGNVSGDIEKIQSEVAKVLCIKDFIAGSMHEISPCMEQRRFGNILRKLAELRAELDRLPGSGADKSEVRKVNDQLNELLYKEEMLWLQRSRIKWLKEGDRNTKIFHQKAVWRAKKNKIIKLKDASERWVTSQEELEALATSYFQDLFTRYPNLNPEEIVQLFEHKVTPDMNEDLCRDFSEKEIADALLRLDR